VAMYWVWPGSILPAGMFFGWAGVDLCYFLSFSVLTVKKSKEDFFF
jgi:hypothetical protein